jgi:hypothetical protein
MAVGVAEAGVGVGLDRSELLAGVVSNQGSKS